MNNRHLSQLGTEEKRGLSQLGIEEVFLQLSRQLLKILCGGQPSIGECKWGKKNEKSPPISIRYRRKKVHVRQESLVFSF